MSKQKKVSDDDLNLFLDAVGEVKPVTHDRHQSTAPKPKPKPRQQTLDDKEVVKELLSDFFHPDDLETGEHLSFMRPGVQKRVMKKLRTGQYAIQDEIDLHGLTVNDCREVIPAFLLHAQNQNHRCVRIIHGRGRKKSVDDAPVLKRMLNHWLSHHKAILAFCSARPEDGGTGAVYVLLKRLD